TLSLRAPGQDTAAASGQPLVELLASGHGRDWAGPRYVATSIGQRLRHRSHELTSDGSRRTLTLTQTDAVTGLDVTSQLSIDDDHLAVRSRTRVTNNGSGPVTLQAVSSLVFGDFGVLDLDRTHLLRGRSDWLAEGRWSRQRLRDAGLPDLTTPGRSFRTRGCIEASSVSSWPTAQELPVGVVDHYGAGWSFQIEHNGGWLWQLGEVPGGLYLALFGPTDEQHGWQLELLPGETFESVPAALALEYDGPVDALTAFRRASRPADHRRDLPVVFNDYMNTVMGDPTAELLHPLVDAAAAAGAEYFVIDAGWYADNGDWWDAVGEWQPSARRFPGGIGAVLDHIRERGMVPGLWLEPEVVGTNSPMALKLPDAAFLQRDGVRVVEHGRYHLDLSSAAAVEHLDEVVDRLVNDLGVGYFKFDYNIRAGVGSDSVAAGAGHGLLRHNLAYLQWVDSLRQRHPGLMLENCASGGMRQDFATVSRFDLQSTSDQEDLYAYAPIAASAPMLVLPEQAANWAYPQPDMTDDAITFTLCTAMLGRFYLSGWLDKLSDDQRLTVAAAVRAHRELRDRIPHSLPFWPTGLPQWTDPWITLGLRDVGILYLTVWRRDTEPGEVHVTLPPAPDGMRWDRPAAVFPAESPLRTELDPSGGSLTVTDGRGVQAARVVKLRAVPTE
ncbi:MAG TPA: alpha-galactosidase, partial [Kribbella sp.]|nr:alpha-galactosidase [Kribbella sp.]